MNVFLWPWTLGSEGFLVLYVCGAMADCRAKLMNKPNEFNTYSDEILLV